MVNLVHKCKNNKKERELIIFFRIFADIKLVNCAMRIKQGHKVREIAGEKVVIMQGQSGVDMTRVIALNDSSILLWNKLLDVDFSADDVKHILLENYDVEEAVATADAQAWIEKMQQAGLVE